jgi:hypothetical protein
MLWAGEIRIQLKKPGLLLCSISFGSSHISIITGLGFETERKMSFKLNLKTLA